MKGFVASSSTVTVEKPVTVKDIRVEVETVKVTHANIETVKVYAKTTIPKYKEVEKPIEIPREVIKLVPKNVEYDRVIFVDKKHCKNCCEEVT